MKETHSGFFLKTSRVREPGVIRKCKGIIWKSSTKNCINASNSVIKTIYLLHHISRVKLCYNNDLSSYPMNQLLIWSSNLLQILKLLWRGNSCQKAALLVMGSWIWISMSLWDTIRNVKYIKQTIFFVHSCSGHPRGLRSSSIFTWKIVRSCGPFCKNFSKLKVLDNIFTEKWNRSKHSTSAESIQMYQWTS